MVTYSIDKLPKKLTIGKQTETGVTHIGFDCSEWLQAWPDLALSAMVTTPSSGAAYPAVTHVDRGVLVWTVTEADTVTHGKGTVEILGEADGLRKLSATVDITILKTTTATTADPPEAVKTWYDTMMEKVDYIVERGVSDEQVASVIGDYFVENPIEAEDVGGLDPVATSGDYVDLKNTPTIPETLPNPHVLTINGETYDGSKAVNVTVAPETHKHTTDDIDGLSEALAQAGKVKTVNNIAPDANGNIDLGELGGEADSVAWENVTGKPDTFPPESHSHSWSSVTEKPSTYPPEAHTHSEYMTSTQVNTAITNALSAIQNASGVSF